MQASAVAGNLLKESSPSSMKNILALPLFSFVVAYQCPRVPSYPIACPFQSRRLNCLHSLDF